MAVNKEFRCKAHGDFEGTHAICPHYGCFSEDVQRVFLTPTSISKGGYKRFDKGLRKTSEMMGIPDWKTAREGETAFAGRAPLGQEVLWGNEVEKVMGTPFSQQMRAAGAPLTVPGRDAATDPYLTINNGMRAAANELGITKTSVPKAEMTRHMQDGKVGG